MSAVGDLYANAGLKCPVCLASVTRCKENNCLGDGIPPLALTPPNPPTPPAPLRIAFVGGQSTGKSTLARWAKNNYQLPMINEVARQVLGELETNFTTLHSDLNATTAYQQEVFKRQVQVSLAHAGGYVSDRAHDNLAYAADAADNYSSIVSDPSLGQYLDHLEDVIIFFVRPHKSLLKDDGVRAPIKWRDVLRIDGIIKYILRSLVVPKTGKPLRYFEIASPILLDRVELVRNVVALRG